MAISDLNKIDFLWKKVGYGVAKTDSTTKKSASNESIASPLLLRGDTIWTDSHEIPAIKPNSSSAFVQVYSDYLANSLECVMDNTSTPNRTWKTNETDWIPVEFGPTYQLKIYVDVPGATDPSATGTRLYPDGSNNDEWFFDYAAGVIHFIGDSLPSPIVTGKVVYAVGARYVGNKGLSAYSPSAGSSNVSGTIPAAEIFVASGSQDTWTLLNTPASAEAIDVYVYDVLQRPGEVFNLVADAITFVDMPPEGTEIYIKYRYPFAAITDNLNDSIENRHLNLLYTSDQYVGDDTQVVFDINPGHNAHSVLVIVDGAILPPQSYSVLNTVLTLNAAPTATAVVDIRYLPV